MSAIGLDINPPLIQTAMVDRQGDVRPLCQAELFPLYAFENKEAMPTPAGLSVWFSNREVPGRGRPANSILEAILSELLAKSSDLLHDPVKKVSVTVPSSLGERYRAWIRRVMHGLGYETTLFNEDQALLKSCPEFCRSSAILIYNLRGTTVDLSFYRFSGKALRIEQLEIVEKCGIDTMELALLEALLHKLDIKIRSIGQYHAVLQTLHETCKQWSYGTPLRLSCKRNGMPYNVELPFAEAQGLIRSIFMRSFEAVRTIIPEGITPLVVFLSPEPQPLVVSHLLESTVGVKVHNVGREKVLAGAALHAVQGNGENRNSLRNKNKKLPERLDIVFDNVAGSEGHVPLKNAPDRAQDLNDPDQITQSIRSVFGSLVEQIAKLPLETIEAIYPACQVASEEFLAKIVDHSAKKMISVHDFERAFNLYNRYWRKQGGFKMLEAPAVGLCLAQARTSFNKREFKTAKRWCQRGLKFSPGNKELLNLKHIMKCNCPKCRAARGQYNRKS